MTAEEAGAARTCGTTEASAVFWRPAGPVTAIRRGSTGAARIEPSTSPVWQASVAGQCRRPVGQHGVAVQCLRPGAGPESAGPGRAGGSLAAGAQAGAL